MKRKIRLLSEREDLGAVFDKTVKTADKVAKAVFVVWALYAVFCIALGGAVLYAVIQGGLWLSRQ